MRTALIALTFAALAPIAFAQTAEKPQQQAPAASASFEARETWCIKYARWFVEQTPAVEAPADGRPTQRLETEFNSCKLDPQDYERQTQAELTHIAETQAG